MRTSKYSGTHYRIGREPQRMATHNAATWRKLAPLLARGPVHYDDLCDAAIGHQTGVKRYQGREAALNAASFVRHCIRRGWLAEATA